MRYAEQHDQIPGEYAEDVAADGFGRGPSGFGGQMGAEGPGGFAGPRHGRGGRRPNRGGFGPGGRGGAGGGPFGPGGFGPGFGPGGPRGRGKRARRGDVRQAILALLAEGSANGYGLIKGIEQRTDGVWRTSPGSVYPTLAQLVDEGLIAPVEGASGSGTEYALTEAGGTYVTEHREELERVWAPAQEEWAEVGDLWTAVRKMLEAARQVGVSGTAEQREQAAAKMDELRRELYRMLGG